MLERLKKASADNHLIVVTRSEMVPHISDKKVEAFESAMRAEFGAGWTRNRDVPLIEVVVVIAESMFPQRILCQSA
ncbi:MAG: hypothetical protein ABSG53_03635 [Thermoguttaceae bacterium]